MMSGVNPALASVGKTLVLAGLALCGLGLLLLLAARLPWLGRLPGDISVRRPGFSFYAPLATCLLLSALLSLIAMLLRRK